MGTILEFDVPTDDFGLEETLIAHPNSVIEIERVVANRPDQVTPSVWVRIDDFETLEAAFEDDPTVEETTHSRKPTQNAPIR